MKNSINQFKINKRIIDSNNYPYIVAEISGNHSQSLNKTFKILEILSDIGVDAVKLQSYQPEDITLPGLYKITDKNSLWYGRDLYELFAEGTLSYDLQEKIIEKSRNLGLEIFSSPFSEKNVEFLMDQKINVFKIASFELNHLPLLKKVAKTKKPVIISTGVSDYTQIKKAIQFLNDNGCYKIMILKTTSSYPSDPKNSNLKTLKRLKKDFDLPVGISDHTPGIGTALASIGLGACLIEKHFTLDKNDGALDSLFSLEPNEFKSLVDESKRAFESIGTVNFDINEKNLLYKRSIYTSEKISKGQSLTQNNIQVLRPYKGIDANFYFDLIGKIVNQDINANQPLKMEHLK